METEQQLLDAIRGGEREAKRRLYERYKGLTMAIAQRYVADYEDVRDVVQDAFVKILTSLDGFRFQGEGTLKAWVSSIVVHEAINHVRSHERMRLTDQLPDEPDDEPVRVRATIAQRDSPPVRHYAWNLCLAIRKSQTRARQTH